jgi:hypothetical protein
MRELTRKLPDFNADSECDFDLALMVLTRATDFNEYLQKVLPDIPDDEDARACRALQVNFFVIRTMLVSL